MCHAPPHSARPGSPPAAGREADLVGKVAHVIKRQRRRAGQHGVQVRVHERGYNVDVVQLLEARHGH